MRRCLPIVALAVCVVLLLGVGLFLSGSLTGIVGTSVPGATDGNERESSRATSGSVVQASERPIDPPAPTPDRATQGPHTLRIQLREPETERPIPDLTVLVAPAGTPSSRTHVDPRRRAVSDSTGTVHFTELDAPGPWDVYVFPFHPVAVRSRLRAAAWSGTLTATSSVGLEEPDAQCLHARLGATAVLRSALPTGVAARDVLFELRGVASLASSEVGGISSFARGEVGADGAVVARFFPLSNSVRAPGMTVHAITVDGLHGLAATRRGAIHDSTVIEIDEPFEQRGVVRFDVVIDDLLGESPTERLLAHAAAWVGLQSVQMARPGDSDPSSSVLVGHRALLSGSTFEFRGLPLQPVKIGNVPRLMLDPYDVSDREPSGGDPSRFQSVSTRELMPVHGAPASVMILVRRIQ